MKSLYDIKTPAYVLDEEKLIKNLEILKYVADSSGAKILLAQKAFSMFSTYELIGKYLSGVTSSGLYEAKLGYEEMGKENHIFSVAYKDDEIDEILEICDHLSFNSFSQWEKFREKALKKGRSCGIRINPEISTQDNEIYNPCSRGSRLGVSIANFREDLLEGLEGLHFHTLCEQNCDALILTLEEVEKKFSKYIKKMKWINFGGGHHITRSDYDVEALIKLIQDFKRKYDIEVYLEPGEAIAYYAGYLVTEVLDFVKNDINIAILDTSAACHMPDVIEMPYRPPLYSSFLADEKEFTYRLAGPTCLAGDIIGDYSFEKELKIGDKLIFEDMAIYSMVKNNTFNGIALPNILIKRKDKIEKVKEFSYHDFKYRLS